MRDPWRIAALALGVMLYMEMRQTRREAARPRFSHLADLAPAELRPLVRAMDATLVALEEAAPVGVRPVDPPGPLRVVPAVR
jgi:hypothetical protein